MIRHGHRGSLPGTRSPEYQSWRKMRERCLNPRQVRYECYGGRGITICEAWASFARFLADMGPRPAGTSLDRIDVDGNYTPDNCRWTTAREQNRNRRPHWPAVEPESWRLERGACAA